MQFGEIATKEAVGAVLAHSVKHAGGVFKKGRVLTAADVAAIDAAGAATVFAARLGPDDVPEDEAASAIAQIAGGAGTTAQAPFTGRANLHAAAAGLAVIDAGRLQALNRLHESLTIATVANHMVVDARQMLATVKVIPFAVPRAVLAEALDIIGTTPLIRVESFKHCRVGLVITRLTQTKPSLIAKSEEAMGERVRALGGEIAAARVVEHRIADVAAAVRDLRAAGCAPILLFGASAIVDRGDVIPAALTAAGGDVVHLGMPVDPGNLTMVGRLDDVAVIGVPSCARSPKRNGFDWVLERVMAGLPVAREDIMDMGAGGLLAEIPTRPSPREEKATVQRAPRIAGIVLAAGRSTRMGTNKMLADFKGQPLVRATVTRVLEFGLDKVIVVTGNDAGVVTAALAGLDVAVVHNDAFASGLASSLKCGVAAAGDADAALVFLGDMPLVDGASVKRLIAAFHPAEHRSIIVPVHKDVRGHPVLWGAAHFADIATLSGDQGAKPLLAQHADDVVEINTANEGVLLDADTPEALERLRAAAMR